MSFLEKFKNKKVMIGVSAIVIVALGSGYFIYRNNKINNEVNELNTQIETYTIADSEKVFINGVIVPTQTKDFNPSTEGEISKLNVTNGKVVKQGDLLFTTKNQNILDEIDGLKAQVNELKKANTENDPTIKTEINKINAQISALDKKAYVNTYAPFAGKVYLNNESENNNNNNMQGQTSSFMTLISSTFYMQGQVSEQDLVKLQMDDPVDVLVFSNNKNLSGRISFISDRPTTNTNEMNMGGQSNMSYYNVNVSFENQEGLIDGFHVQGSVKISNSLVKVPTTAILENKEDGTAYVFKDLDGILKKQVVEIHDKNEEFTVISSGLEPNDIVIRYISPEMQEGDPVNPGNADATNTDTPSNVDASAETNTEGAEN